MQDFLLMMENRYKTSASSTNSLIFLIKVRLDISNLLSIKKKTLNVGLALLCKCLRLRITIYKRCFSGSLCIAPAGLDCRG
jgi:hypothetical protein